MFGLIKFLIPIVIGYFIFKKITSLFALGSSQNSDQAGRLNDPNDVIEICPECGTELGRRHKCKPTS